MHSIKFVLTAWEGHVHWCKLINDLCIIYRYILYNKCKLSVYVHVFVSAHMGRGHAKAGVAVSLCILKWKCKAWC